jgi:hypothetical protein
VLLTMTVFAAGLSPATVCARNEATIDGAVSAAVADRPVGSADVRRG